MLEAGGRRALGGAPEAADETTHEAAYRRALLAELDRRLVELHATSGDGFGRLGLADAVVVIALCVLLPAVMVWMWR